MPRIPVIHLKTGQEGDMEAEDLLKYPGQYQRVVGPPETLAPPGPRPSPGFEAIHQRAMGEGLPVRTEPFVGESMIRATPGFIGAMAQRIPEIASTLVGGPAGAIAGRAAAMGTRRGLQALGRAGVSARIPGTGGAGWLPVSTGLGGRIISGGIAGPVAEATTALGTMGAGGAVGGALRGEDPELAAEQTMEAAFPYQVGGQAARLPLRAGVGILRRMGVLPPAGGPTIPFTRGRSAQTPAERAPHAFEPGEKETIREAMAERREAGLKSEARFKALNKRIREAESEMAKQGSKEVETFNIGMARERVGLEAAKSVESGEPLASYVTRHQENINEVAKRSPKIAAAMRESAETGAEKLAERDVFQHVQRLYPQRSVKTFEDFHRLAASQEGAQLAGQEYKQNIRDIAAVAGDLRMPTLDEEGKTIITSVPAMKAFEGLWKQGMLRRTGKRGAPEISYQERKDLILEDLEAIDPTFAQEFERIQREMAQRMGFYALVTENPKIVIGGRLNVRAAKEALLDPDTDARVFARIGKAGMDSLKEVTGAYAGGGLDFFPK